MHNDNVFDENEIKRIAWRCRRGMLEVDIFLQQFFHTQFLELHLGDKKRFVRLLEAKDPDLYAWFMGYDDPADADDLRICQLIRRSMHEQSISN